MKKLSPKQKAIAAKAPPPDKIDAKDFAVLKAEKAKGRGTGLQDEKIKPGKVQKAFLGKMIKGAGKSVGRLFGRKKSSTATPGAATMSGSGKGMGKMLPQLLQKAIDDGIIKPASKGRMMKAKDGKAVKADPTKPVNPFQKKPKVKSKLPGRIGTALGIASMMVPAAYAAAKQYKDYKSAKNRDKAKVKNKMVGGMAKKYSVGGGADAGRAGSIKGINANLQDKAERRLNVPDKTDIKNQKASVTKLKEQAKRSRLEKMKERRTGRPVYERMGGGMMQRPMGYKSGTMVKARGCKLGRTRPTKIT